MGAFGWQIIELLMVPRFAEPTAHAHRLLSVCDMSEQLGCFRELVLWHPRSLRVLMRETGLRAVKFAWLAEQCSMVLSSEQTHVAIPRSCSSQQQGLQCTAIKSLYWSAMSHNQGYPQSIQ